MSRSKLEEDLYESMRLLSMTEQGFPMPVREYHPFHCCSHPKHAHGEGGTPDMSGPACWMCMERGGAVPWHEYSKPRNWRCDFAWPDRKLIVEVEGGVYSGGRHTRGSGYTKDTVKYNAIVNAGWNLQRFTGEQVRSGEALNVIRRVIEEESRP